MIHRWCVLFIAVIGSSSGLLAATFRNLELVYDGSQAPPGDVLKCTLVFYPGDDRLRAEIRAYHISIPADVLPSDPAAPAPEPAPEPDPVLVKSRSAVDRDENGHYRKAIDIVRPDKDLVHTLSWIVPFADLNLGVGEHRLAYEVQVYRGDDLQFTCATPLGTMVITEEARSAPRLRSALKQQTIEQPITVLSQGNLIEIKQQKISQYNVFEELTDGRKIDIPGGFRRRFEAMAAAPSEDDNPLKDESLAINVGRRAWAPSQSPLIYFATNRQVDPNAKIAERYTNAESPVLTFGSMRVNVPIQNHTKGKLERPRFWQYLDADKHFFIDEAATNEIAEAYFFEGLKGIVKPGDRDLMVFVHGFNNTFDFAAMRLAQTQHDAQFPGQSILFSWPSKGQGDPGSYREDEGRSARAIPHLARVLKQLVLDRGSDPRAGDIHLIAHSMGNRVLLGALEALAADPDMPQKPFGHVVYAAPDEKAMVFQLQAQTVIPLAKSSTLYFCMEDKALLFSMGINGKVNRAGQVIIPIPNLDNIDAAMANTSFLGHDYYTSNNQLLGDLELLWNFDASPARRPKLQATHVEGPRVNRYQYWEFPSTD